ncbi:hypothetical protein [Allorhizocola rhizosphaerae]|uniref:hypothetical protein n=1 Tax=Allorhizocola rhizosphaerae TaxID=1872709 RepID=UPI000E3DF23A|nr:hypothetical protein [Allorhizocola rhizosphaerae]
MFPAQALVWIWTGLGVFGALVLVLFGMLARAQRRSEDRLHGVLGPQSQAELAREAQELEIVAADTLRAAQQAATALERAEAALAEAEQERELAWRLHSEAAIALEKANTELDSMPVDVVLRGPEQRFVSQAARDAYRRGELTLEQLHAVWQRLDGWDSTIDEKTHEVSRLRAETGEAFRRYHMASAAERAARKAVEVAQIAARALRQEATDAACDAVLAQMRVQRRGKR